MGNLYYTLVSILIFVFYIGNATKSVQADDDFIRKTCKSTQYVDLCISSLKSDPSSSKSDLKGLATIMIRVGIANASETYAYLSSQVGVLPGTATSDTAAIKKVVQLCVTKYANANDSLKSSLEDLAMENYDYASMHVMAAADYPNACLNAFKRFGGSGYPPGLKLRQDGFQHICTVVLGIIQQLYSITTSYFP